MPSIKIFLFFVLMALAAFKGTSAAPIPDQVNAVFERDLEHIVRPVLGAVNPLAHGVEAGLEHGPGNIKVAVDAAGAALDETAHGAAHIAAGAAAGAGYTVGAAPHAVDKTVNALEHGGIVGSVIDTVFGH